MGFVRFASRFIAFQANNSSLSSVHIGPCCQKQRAFNVQLRRLIQGLLIVAAPIEKSGQPFQARTNPLTYYVSEQVVKLKYA